MQLMWRVKKFMRSAILLLLYFRCNFVIKETVKSSLLLQYICLHNFLQYHSMSAFDVNHLQSNINVVLANSVGYF